MDDKYFSFLSGCHPHSVASNLVVISGMSVTVRILRVNKKFPDRLCRDCWWCSRNGATTKDCSACVKSVRVNND